MRVQTLNECNNKIKDYLKDQPTGWFLVVNADNYSDCREIINKFAAFPGNTLISVSNFAASSFPNTAIAITEAAKTDNSMLIGLSQAMMLLGEDELKKGVDLVVNKSVSGHSVALLTGCEKILKNLTDNSLKVGRRIVLLSGRKSYRPSINLIPEQIKDFAPSHSESIADLLKRIENLGDSQDAAELNLIYKDEYGSFENSMYFVRNNTDIFEQVKLKYPEVALFAQKSMGTDEEWLWLMELTDDKSSFDGLIKDKFGTLTNLAGLFGEERIWKDENLKWLYFLALKRAADSSDSYLSRVIKKSNNMRDFERFIFNELLEVPFVGDEFERLYGERKALIKKMNPPNLEVLAEEYCSESASKYLNDQIYYLTDLTEHETLVFFKLLAEKEYSRENIRRAVHRFSEELYKYLEDFVFGEANLTLSESDSALPGELTDYFREYKYQKFLNKVDEEFLEKVNAYAKEKPRLYTKVKTRNNIIKDADKSGAYLYMIDALGAEYAGYILKKCEERGIACSVEIGRAEIPTLTEKNSDFLNLFGEGSYANVKELDELKHRSAKYNYEKCIYPIHIPEELEIIDKVVKEAANKVLHEGYDRAIITGDHGSSRLAVLYGKDAPKYELLEKGVHSGRCCPTDETPDIEYATNEGGFAVLANYERFKGGRAANLEVHGGASLEEVLVPVITITRKSAGLAFKLKEEEILLIPKEPLKLVVSSAAPVANLRMNINGTFYDGLPHLDDNRVYTFEIPEIKKRGEYTAHMYSGDENLGIDVIFKTKKKTKENDLF